MYCLGIKDVRKAVQPRDQPNPFCSVPGHNVVLMVLVSLGNFLSFFFPLGVGDVKLGSPNMQKSTK